MQVPFFALGLHKTRPVALACQIQSMLLSRGCASATSRVPLRQTRKEPFHLAEPGAHPALLNRRFQVLDRPPADKIRQSHDMLLHIAGKVVQLLRSHRAATFCNCSITV